MKLKIELIPQSSFYSNVRSEVSKKEWDVIRKKCYEEANHKCEICGGNGKSQGRKHKVECHEIWNYDLNNQLQKLEGFIALCPMCHKAKHFGLARMRGEENRVITHLMKVNNLPKNKIDKHIKEVWVEWFVRNKVQWNLDISYIEEYIN